MLAFAAFAALPLTAARLLAPAWPRDFAALIARHDAASLLARAAFAVAIALGLLEALFSWALPVAYGLTQERARMRSTALLILFVTVGAGVALGRAAGALV